MTEEDLIERIIDRFDADELLTILNLDTEELVELLKPAILKNQDEIEEYLDA